MKAAHGAYEALAGAILLGEATAAERKTYADHAARCPRCDRDLAASGTLLSETFAAARQDETWRPFVRDGVNERIERRRSLATRRITTSLGAAVALTLAFNVALAIGVQPHGGRLALPAARTGSAALQTIGAPVAEAPKTSPAAAKLQPAHAARPAPPRVIALNRAHPRLRQPVEALDVDPAQTPNTSEPGVEFPALLVALPPAAVEVRGRR